MGDGERLTAQMKEVLAARGADLVGVADLRAVDENARGGFPFGVAVAVAYDPPVIGGIGSGPTKDYHDACSDLNRRLDDIVSFGEDYLGSLGYYALARTRRRAVWSEESLRTTLPHKTVARLSGLGWIGRCALLVTREYGAAVRLSTLLTDAPLIADRPADACLCPEGCSACRDACPAGAVSGRTWKPGMERREFWDARACRDECENFSGVRGLCGRCIFACPFTQGYLKRSGTGKE